MKDTSILTKIRDTTMNEGEKDTPKEPVQGEAPIKDVFWEDLKSEKIDISHYDLADLIFPPSIREASAPFVQEDDFIAVRYVPDPVDPSTYIDRPCDSYEAYQAQQAELEAQGFRFLGNYWTNRQPRACKTCPDAVAHLRHAATMHNQETVATNAFTTKGQRLEDAVGFFARKATR